MRRTELDYILNTMLDSQSNVSDLNLTVGKPFQVEASGELTPVVFNGLTGMDNLTPFQTEIVALNLMNSDRRLSEILISQGSCDLSYDLPEKARFRVNIFSQRGSYSIVPEKTLNSHSDHCRTEVA